MFQTNLLPFSPRKATPTTWPGFALNYGNDLFGGSYSASQVLSDLLYLRSLGIKVLRIAMPQYTDSGNIANFKLIIATAKKLGFYCIWGVAHNAIITSLNWSTIKIGLLAQALTSASWPYPPDEWMIDNEATLQHDGSIASTTIRADLKTMATTVKGYASWKVSFGEAKNDFEGNINIDIWASIGIGNFDYASFHLYDTLGGLTLFVNDIVSKFGAKGYLSEWSAAHDFVSGGYTEAQYAVDLAARLQAIINSGIRLACLYTYRSSDNWNILTPTGFHLAWQRLLSST